MNVEGLDLLEWFVAMERSPDEWSSVNEDFAIRKDINQSAKILAYEAYVNINQAALAALHECARIEQVNVDRRKIFSDVQSVLESAMLQF